MAYSSYFPQSYYQNQPVYNVPQYAQNAPAQTNNGIIWVQGENAAKSYPVGAGQSVLLMDSEDSVMYIKSTDQSGMPQPLRVFEYKERTNQHSEAGIAKSASNDYVSRSEFEEFRKTVKKNLEGIRRVETEPEVDADG